MLKFPPQQYTTEQLAFHFPSCAASLELLCIERPHALRPGKAPLQYLNCPFKYRLFLMLYAHLCVLRFQFAN